jgi:hypothetical protein
MSATDAAWEPQRPWRATQRVAWEALKGGTGVD